MAEITPIDAAIPNDGDRIKEGAERIRETRAKLNELIAGWNSQPAEAVPSFQKIYWDTTTPATLTIPTGITKMHILNMSGGGGGGSNVSWPGGVITPGADGDSGQVVAGATIDVVAGTAYTITIGAGGAAADGSVNVGQPGGNTTITTLVDSVVTTVAIAPGGGVTSAAPTPSVAAAKAAIYTSLFVYIAGAPGGDGQGVSVGLPTAGSPGWAYIYLSNQSLE